jgi:hypothetical protein
MFHLSQTTKSYPTLLVCLSCCMMQYEPSDLERASIRRRSFTGESRAGYWSDNWHLRMLHSDHALWRLFVPSQSLTSCSSRAIRGQNTSSGYDFNLSNNNEKLFLLRVVGTGPWSLVSVDRRSPGLGLAGPGSRLGLSP